MHFLSEKWAISDWRLALAQPPPSLALLEYQSVLICTSDTGEHRYNEATTDARIAGKPAWAAIPRSLVCLLSDSAFAI